ncbi:MAG: hypothetical protein QRY74_05400 [Chlamydia sp.]
MMNMPKTHPIDLLIDQHIQNLNQDKYYFEVSNSNRYSSGYLVNPYLVFVSSIMQREDITDAEADFCDVFGKIIDTYNHIPEIRPYLSTFPVTIKEANVRLSYESSPDIYQQPPYFCFMRIDQFHRQYLEFRKWTGPQHLSVNLLPVFYKKKCTAISALKEYIDTSVVRRRNEMKKIIILDQRFEIENEFHDRKILRTIATKLCSMHHLYISALSNCAIGGFNNYREICAGFWAQNKNMGLEEARLFSKEFIREFLIEIEDKKPMDKKIYKDSETQQKIKETLDWFCFRITFWDESLNRVEEPYIAQIQCQDGKILYFTADEGQRLQQIFEEPIPEQFFPKKSEQQ